MFQILVSHLTINDQILKYINLDKANFTERSVNLPIHNNAENDEYQKPIINLHQS